MVLRGLNGDRPFEFIVEGEASSKPQVKVVADASSKASSSTATLLEEVSECAPL